MATLADLQAALAAEPAVPVRVVVFPEAPAVMTGALWSGWVRVRVEGWGVFSAFHDLVELVPASPPAGEDAP